MSSGFIRGNGRAIDQGGNRGSVETEWRKEMGIDEGGKTRNSGYGRKYSVGRD
jgi:hypothetical protein